MFSVTPHPVRHRSARATSCNRSRSADRCFFRCSHLSENEWVHEGIEPARSRRTAALRQPPFHTGLRTHVFDIVQRANRCHGRRLMPAPDALVRIELTSPVYGTGTLPLSYGGAEFMFPEFVSETPRGRGPSQVTRPLNFGPSWGPIVSDARVDHAYSVRVAAETRARLR